jgi:surface-anchored protein
MKNISTIILVMLMLFSLTCVSQAVVEYTAGHADVGLAESSGLELHLHVEGATIGGTSGVEGEYEPDEVIIVVPNSTLYTREAGSQWDMIGNSAGDDTWRLPQSQQTGVPFLGIGAEEASENTYVDNEITLTLLNMNGPAGGEFSMWQTDQFEVPAFFMSTSDASADFFVVDLDEYDHYHVNWGFTQPGTYELEFQAYAELIAGASQSSTSTFTFEVVPEPVSLLLFGIGGFFLRKRKISRQTFVKKQLSF